MKNLYTLFLFLAIAFSSNSQVANTWSVKFSTAIANRYKPNVNAMTSKGWEYSNSIMLHGMEKVYNNVTDSTRYLTYIQAYVDAYVNGSGAFSPAQTVNSLDKIHPGIICLFLWEKTGLTKYRTIATTLKNILVGSGITYGRTSNGIFWHKDNGTTYDNVVMLDGMYMAHPFLAKYGSLFSDAAAIDTAVNQILFCYNQMYVSATHLIKHAWTSTPASYTWDGAGGNSNTYWSRAMGWYMMALVDVLKYVPAAHPKRAQLITALDNLAVGIKNYQDASSGLWYQVLDKTSVSLSGNYLETSGSAMFVYAIKTAITNGWISAATYSSVAQNGWNGLKTLTIDTWPTDGGPRINNFAGAMSVLNNDAAYVASASVDCPPPSGTNHPHGYAAILMAASVMEFPLTTLPVKFVSFTEKEFADKIHLEWENADESDMDHYEVQKSVNASDFTTIGSVTSTGSFKYAWDDRVRENRTVYYRIKAISIDGAIHYTGVIPVAPQGGKFMMKISPNPAEGNGVNVLLSNINPGKYTIKLTNSAGVVVQTTTVDMQVSNGISTIPVPAGTAKGLYYVQLEGNGLRVNQSVLIK
jgi:unsaturated rhamnogalacturonyl hydrolase